MFSNFSSFVFFWFQPVHIPPFAACLFFELHRIKGKYYIELFYKRERGEDPTRIPIPKCGKRKSDPCAFDKFARLYKDIIPSDDYELECALSSGRMITN